MSIAPIQCSVDVKAPAPRAFELFTANMGSWWPKGHSVAKHPHAQIVVEPQPGGRWFERDADGNETQWGKVIAYEPPQRLLLGWQLTRDWQFDPDFLTHVELTFAPLPGGGTRVTLEHRDLERFGAGAQTHADSLNGGWKGLLGHYAAFATAA